MQKFSSENPIIEKPDLLPDLRTPGRRDPLRPRSRHITAEIALTNIATSWVLAAAAAAAGSKPLEQACSVYGRSVAASRSKDATRYSRAGDAILAKTTDPDARAAAAAED